MEKKILKGKVVLNFIPQLRRLLRELYILRVLISIIAPNPYDMSITARNAIANVNYRRLPSLFRFNGVITLYGLYDINFTNYILNIHSVTNNDDINNFNVRLNNVIFNIERILSNIDPEFYTSDVDVEIDDALVWLGLDFSLFE